MPDSRTPQAPTSNPKPAGPTAKQLRYLKQLALQRGVSFAYPATRAQASAEIQALKQRRPDPYADRRREQLDVSRDMATRRGDDAKVRDAEITGYLASATWRTTETNR
jgi:hypothetical protein